MDFYKMGDKETGFKSFLEKSIEEED